MTVIYNMSIDRADKPWIGDRRLTEEALLDIGRVNPKDRTGLRANGAGACQRAAVTSGTGAPVRGGPKATSQRLGPAPDLVSRERRGQVGAAGQPQVLAPSECSQGAKERLASRAACGHGRVGGGRTSGPGAAGAAGAARRRGDLRARRRFALLRRGGCRWRLGQAAPGRLG